MWRGPKIFLKVIFFNMVTKFSSNMLEIACFICFDSVDLTFFNHSLQCIMIQKKKKKRVPSILAKSTVMYSFFPVLPIHFSLFQFSFPYFPWTLHLKSLQSTFFFASIFVVILTYLLQNLAQYLIYGLLLFSACYTYSVPYLIYTSTYNVVFGHDEIVNGNESLPYLPMDQVQS